MRFLRFPRRAIERLGPYPSLILVAVPLALVEPLKLATLLIAGNGHWITGIVAMICAYAISLLVTERLFRIVKPKLMTLPWFAASWKWFIGSRRKAFGWFRMSASARPGRRVKRGPRRRAASRT